MASLSRDLIQFSESEGNNKQRHTNDVLREFDPLGKTPSGWVQFGEESQESRVRSSVKSLEYGTVSNGDDPSVRSRQNTQVGKNREGGVFDKEEVWDDLQDLFGCPIPVRSSRMLQSNTAPELGSLLSRQSYTTTKPPRLRQVPASPVGPFFFFGKHLHWNHSIVECQAFSLIFVPVCATFLM